MKVKIKQKKEIAEKAAHIKKKSSFIWLGTYVTISVISFVAYFLLRLHSFDLLGKYRILLQRLSLAIFIAVLILAATKLIELFIHKNSKGKLRDTILFISRGC